MLETAVGNGPEKLWLQQKISETGGVYANIAALLALISSGDGQVAFLARSISGCWRCGCCVICLEFLVRVVNEIFFVRHGVKMREGKAVEAEDEIKWKLLKRCGAQIGSTRLQIWAGCYDRGVSLEEAYKGPRLEN